MVEGERLDTRFEPNVKGTTSLSALPIFGTITSERGTASERYVFNLQLLLVGVFHLYMSPGLHNYVHVVV